MSLNSRPLFARSLALLILGASWMVACGAPDLDGTGTSGGDGDVTGTGDSGIQVTSGSSTGDIDDIVNQEPTANCGDGIRQSDEACDDGTPEGGDGCGANCRFIEDGWICPVTQNDEGDDVGEPCRPYAKCGDGVVVFPEQCDDANSDTPGCSESCKIEIGYKCDGSPSVCVPTVCGDGLIEGSETCDDNNSMPFDGCSDECQAEPQCTDAGCTGTCGDGLVLNDEECDDGNTLDGDGCSATCTEEPGYMCQQGDCDPSVEECALSLPIVYRDFTADHADFESEPCSSRSVDLDLVQDKLNENGKPVARDGNNCFSTATFAEWYGDAAGDYITSQSKIVLYPNDAGGFVNRWGPMGEQYPSTGQTEYCGGYPMFADCQAASDAGMCNGITYDPDVHMCWTPDDLPRPTTCGGGANCIAPVTYVDGTPTFFPLDGADTAEPRYPAKIPAPIYGGVGYPWEAGGEGGGAAPADSPLHNFYFTSEVTYWFEYDSTADAKLTFIGDDDVWVFLNRKLAVDLGGIHVPIAGYVRLNGGSVEMESWEPPEQLSGMNTEIRPLTTAPVADFGLEDGKVYEIKVFQAERRREGSSFQLTLAGFNTARSECTAECGDGIIAGGEQCDDGAENNIGGHTGAVRSARSGPSAVTVSAKKKRAKSATTTIRTRPVIATAVAIS